MKFPIARANPAQLAPANIWTAMMPGTLVVNSQNTGITGNSTKAAWPSPAK